MRDQVDYIASVVIELEQLISLSVLMKFPKSESQRQGVSWEENILRKQPEQKCVEQPRA